MHVSPEQDSAAPELGTLIAHVAHEVRGPLFAISALIESIEPEHGDDRILTARDWERLESQIARLNALMHDLLDYTNPRPPVFGEVAVPALLNECVDLAAAEAAKASVRIDLGEAPDRRLVVDARRIVQALVNIVVNAVQHTPAGGHVALRVEDDGDGITCIVEDGGSGFSPQDIASALQPFYSRRRGGTGLGLSIAKRMLDIHRARIELRNGERGGVVKVWIPESRQHPG